MVDTPGLCRELDYCSIGQMRTLVRVPLGKPFVCPECGKPLRAPALINEPLSRKRLAIGGLGTLSLLVLLYECAAPSRPTHHLQLAVLQQQQQARLAAARPPAAPVVAKPELKPAVPPPPAAMPPSTSVQPAPPTGRGAYTPGSKVTMECSIDAAGVPSDCTMAHEPPVIPVQPRPPAPPRPAAAPPPAAKPPLAAREPSNVPVAGGLPAYPSDYVRDGRAGEVSVDCVIEATGEPQHCKVRDYIGGRRFAEAVVNWLNTGNVRFQPFIQDGKPVAEERHWHIAFPPR